MTLETQYKQYIENNPSSTYTFEEWKENILKPFVLKDALKQINNLLLQKETEEFRNMPHEGDWGNDKDNIFDCGFIAGTNSKFVQKKILEAQIEIYQNLLIQSDNHFAAICKYMIKERNTLQQKLKELENE